MAVNGKLAGRATIPAQVSSPNDSSWRRMKTKQLDCDQALAGKLELMDHSMKGFVPQRHKMHRTLPARGGTISDLLGSYARLLA